MWGLMALISGAILAPDAIKRSRIPEFGTIAYWRYSHPEMSLLDIVKTRNAMNDDLEDWEVKMLIEAGYTLDMMCKLAKPTYNRLMEDEKRKEEVDNSASYDNSPLIEESLVETDESKDLTDYENLLRTEENLAVNSATTIMVDESNTVYKLYMYEVYKDESKEDDRCYVVYNAMTNDFIGEGGRPSYLEKEIAIALAKNLGEEWGKRPGGRQKDGYTI